MPRSGTVRIMVCSALVFFAARDALAETGGFPYEAIVEADEALVYCGPGTKTFYPTLRMKRGDHVIVRRHDPGGWFMIDPPPGSFSLMRVADIESQGNAGTVKRLDQGQASVRIGSAIDPTLDSIFQRKLSTGERVEILGEVTIPRRDGQVPMFKIRPPRGEFRWIDGQNLTSVDTQARGARTAVPVDASSRPPSQQRRATHPNIAREPAPAVAATRDTVRKPVAENSVDQSPPVSSVTVPVADPRTRLEQLDIQFRDMVRLQPTQWNLVGLESAYRLLQSQSNSPAMRVQLELRLSSLDHYKQVKSEYDDYFRLVSDTSRKDAELAAIQGRFAPQNTRPPIGSSMQQEAVATAPFNAPSNQAFNAPNNPAYNAPNNNAGTGNDYATMPTFSVRNPQASPNGLAPPTDPRSGGNAFVGPILEPPTTEAAPLPSAETTPPADPGQPRSMAQPPYASGSLAPNSTYGAATSMPYGSSTGSPNGAAPNLTNGPSTNRSGVQSPTMPAGPSTGFDNRMGSPSMTPVPTEPLGDGNGRGPITPAPLSPNPVSPTPNSPAPRSDDQRAASEQFTFGSPVPPAEHNVGALKDFSPAAEGMMNPNVQSAPNIQGAPNSPGASYAPIAPNATIDPRYQQGNRFVPTDSAGSPYSAGPVPNPNVMRPENFSAQPQQPSAFQQPPNAYQQPSNMFQRQPSGFQQQSSGFPQQPGGFQQQPGTFVQQPGVYQPSAQQSPFTPPPQTVPMPALAAPRQIRPQGSPPLDGAGIIQRAVTQSPGGPRHVLLAPNGRILAYLATDREFNLDAYLGRPMGLVGPRTFHPELQSDLIIVRGMIPVRLTQ